MSENNKETIEKIALSLFVRKGYSSVGVQEICEESGITKPTLYHYFGSKRGLLEHLASTKGEALLTSLEEALIYQHDFLFSLKASLSTMVSFALENKEYFSLHCILLSAPEGSEESDVYKVYQERLNALVLSFFQESAREFGNMRGKEKLYSRLFSNLLLSTAVLVLSGELSADESTLNHIVHSFVYGVAS